MDLESVLLGISWCCGRHSCLTIAYCLLSFESFVCNEFPLLVSNLNKDSVFCCLALTLVYAIAEFRGVAAGL